MMHKDLRAVPAAILVALALAVAACTDAGTETSAEGDPATASDTGEVENETDLEAPELDPLPDLNERQQRLAVATARAVPPDDPQITGSPPGFTRIVAGTVEGRGDTIRFTLEMSGELPQVMPDGNSHMIVAWNITGNKRHDTFGVTAQATTEGWTTMAGHNSDVFELPGTFTVEGNRFVMEVSWSALGVPRRFDWSVASTWQQIDGEDVHAAAQNIPAARFPN